MIYIFLSLEIIALVAISRWVINPFLGILRREVSKHLANTDFNAGKEQFTKTPAVNLDGVDDLLKVKRRDAIVQAILIGDRTKGLNWLTSLIAFLEAVVFGVITFLLFRENLNDAKLLDAFKTFGSFLGGWLAIKVLSSHQAWSDAFAGKAYYYISLLGTILNILLGSLAGYTFYLYIY